MWKNIPTERLEILEKIGFGDVPDCDPSFAFHTAVVALNTKMVVRGDHASDIAYIYYACVEDGEEVLDGFFYAPSLFEHPFLNYQTFDINSLLKEIEEHSNVSSRFVGVGGISMIFVSVDEYDWKMKDLYSPLSDMLKLVGVLDYFMSREFNVQLELVRNSKL